MEQNWLDIQHRGYWAYLQETADSPSCQRLCRNVVPVPGVQEQIDTVLYDCQIDLEWIEKIEEGLPFIDNALKESRQFILRQGDVVPVEKVKRVSRESVEHLTRHSNLIAHLPHPNESPIPDKLYMTESVGTYAVYENRFLYMLLRELQDFLAYRYRKIRQITESFTAHLNLRQEVSDGPRSIRYHLNYEESSKTPEELVNPKTRRTINRIVTVLQEVDRLLKTPLMTDVSAAPLLHPPITRTNVLLHNPNFAAAFGLYSYLAAYEGDGFQPVVRQRGENDEQPQTRQEIATLISLTSYLSHRWSGLQETLEKRFLAEQALRRRQAEQEQKARLALLKSRAGASSEDTLAYLLELERRNESLESYAEQIQSSHALQQETQTRLDLALQAQENLRKQIALLESSLSAKDQQMVQASQDQDRLRAAIGQLQVQADDRVNTLQREYDSQLQQQKDLFLQEYEALAESLRLENARYHAREGTAFDLSSREAFAELEAEYAAFRRFYRKQWRAAKRQIRQKHLNSRD